jgi:HD-GYP domain-containing protein (c-di-GMP phosphodiesterase class II)
MNILLILLSREARQMITFCLENRYKVSVTETSSTSEAILSAFDLKKAMPDLIICDHPLNSASLHEFLASKKLKIPVLICAQDPTQQKPSAELQLFYTAPGTVLRDAEKRIQDHLNKSTLTESDEATEFLSIRTELLLNASPLQSDLYIRLSETKYIKLMRKGDTFDALDYEKYGKQKKIQFLFIHRNELVTVIEKFKQEINRLLVTTTTVPKESNEVSTMIQETAQELINKVGATPEVQEMVKKNIQLTLHTVGRNPKLKNIIDNLQKEKDRYIASHSVYLAQLSCTLAAAMEWHSESTFHKLNLAAYLHDITLTHQELAKIHDLKELEAKKAKFTKEQFDAYKAHPQHGAELAQKFNEVPPDVDTLIAQHHERPDGSGFPRGLTHKQIGPLSSVFISSHDLVTYIFENDKPFVMQEFLETVKDRYDFGNFRKILKCLGQIKI